jgi:hypothetical protein
VSYNHDNALNFCPQSYTHNNELDFAGCSATQDVTFTSNSVVTSIPAIVSFSSLLANPVPVYLASDSIVSIPSLLSFSILSFVPVGVELTSDIIITGLPTLLSTSSLLATPAPVYLTSNSLISEIPTLLSISSIAFVPPGVALTSNVIVTAPSVLSTSSLLFVPPGVTLASDAIITAIPGLLSTSSLYFDSLVNRGLYATFNVRYTTDNPISIQSRSAYNHSPNITITRKINSVAAKPLFNNPRIIWNNGIVVDNIYKLAYTIGYKAHANINCLWNYGLNQRHLIRINYNQALKTHIKIKARYVYTQKIPQLFNFNFSLARPATLVIQHLFNRALATGRLINIFYTHGRPIEIGHHSPATIPTIVIPPRVCGNTLIFRPFRQPNELYFYNCQGSTSIPEQEVYFVPNTFSLIRTDGGIEIRTLSFNMSLDSDSFAWQWSATVDPAQFVNILSIDQLNPIDLVATINGIPFNLIIEKVSKERTNCSKSLSISGRSHSAYLAAPYATVTTAYATGEITAQQAAEAALTTNGVSIGWSIEFGLNDWLIAAEAWANTGTYIEHLARIAEAGGGYLQPHDTANTIKFKKYYPTAPWDWQNAPMVLLLPESVVVTEGIEYSFKPDYTGVYVHGGASGGRLDLVKKTGTPGDLLAPIVVDDLATDSVMTTQRGLRVLGDTQAVATLSLSLPLLAETGIIRPGTMIQYLTRFGMVRGVSVTFGNDCKPRQTIEVETHEYL